MGKGVNALEILHVSSTGVSSSVPYAWRISHLRIHGSWIAHIAFTKSVLKDGREPIAHVQCAEYHLTAPPIEFV
jgi:hypothetical protein